MARQVGVGSMRAMSAVDCKQETSPRPGTPGLARYLGFVEALDDGEAQGDPSLDVSSGRSISERGCCLKEKFSIDVMLGTLSNRRDARSLNLGLGKHFAES